MTKIRFLVAASGLNLQPSFLLIQLIICIHQAQMFLSGIKMVLKSAVLNYFNFPRFFFKIPVFWLEIKFPDYSPTLEHFLPDDFLTCGKPASKFYVIVLSQNCSRSAISRWHYQTIMSAKWIKLSLQFLKGSEMKTRSPMWSSILKSLITHQV